MWIRDSPEYRTMPMVWYIPPLSPVVDVVSDSGNDGEDARTLFAAIDKLRIPIGYLAELFTAGDVGPVDVALRRLAAMRSYMRGVNLDDERDERIAAAVGMTGREVEEMDRLLAIAERELAATQEAFRQLAGKLNSKEDPLAVWAKTKANQPAPGQLVRTGREQLDELKPFSERNALISVPPGEPVIVAPTPEFYRWSFASMWTPGPFEARPSQAVYYLTDADASWPEERKREHLRDFNIPTLWTISIHEVYPGHYVHYQLLRRGSSEKRRPGPLAAAAFGRGRGDDRGQAVL